MKATIYDFNNVRLELIYLFPEDFKERVCIKNMGRFEIHKNNRLEISCIPVRFPSDIDISQDIKYLDNTIFLYSRIANLESTIYILYSPYIRTLIGQIFLLVEELAEMFREKDLEDILNTLKDILLEVAYNGPTL